MKCTLRVIAVVLLLAGSSSASPAEAERVEKSYQRAMEQWTAQVRAASTLEARDKAWSARPLAATFAKDMWTIISPALREEWTLAPAAWFLSITSGLRITQPNGSNSPAFAEEINAVRAAIQTDHMRSAKLAPVCLALATNDDPHSLALLEKIQTAHTDKSVQGVAALAIAIRLKSIGDDAALLSKRLTLLRKAIINSAEVEINGISVAKLAEDELYIIRFLTKGRTAPDLSGTDSGMRPMRLSDQAGKVVVLLFWNSGVQEAGRVLEMATALEKKFAGKPFAVIGVNNDTVKNLRSMQEQAELVTFSNFSDPDNRLANEYRVGLWPLAYVLDGKRKIHYAGQPGAFVELTAAALINEPPAAAPK
jgi:peroxiredoxin